MIVFRIYCNFFIVLSNRQKTCTLMDFSFFLEGKICAPEKSGVSQRDTGYRARKMSRPAISTAFINIFSSMSLKSYDNYVTRTLSFEIPYRGKKTPGKVTNFRRR